MSSDIQVFPTSIRKIKVRYYKQPEGLLALTGAKTSALPNYSYTVSGAVELFNISGSVDFELPNHYVPELVIEIAKMVGINLRQADVYTYATNEQQNNKTK